VAELLSSFRSLRSLRKELPLPVRMGYGWLRRKWVPHPIRDNEEFQRVYHWLQKTQWWSQDQLEDYQLEQLQALIRHAYENVPYYRRVFDGHGLKPKDIATLDDLHKIPILTKDDVRENHEDFVARNIDRDRLRFWTTGGSSGTPLGVYHDKYTGQLYECAYRYRQWRWAGYRFWDRKAWLCRDEMKRITRAGTRACWDYNTHENELVLAARDMTENNMQVFVDKIREFEPRFLLGIPSALENLARFMKRNSIDDIEIRGAVFCWSETLYPWQRELIESQFQSRIFSEYGMSEHAADAVECERHEGYHVSMEYGILELVDKNNEPITEPGVLGKVVGTGLLQYVMPFIRYATDDLAVYAKGECSCGRQLTLIEDFKGRSREFFVSKAGRLIPVQLVWTGRDPVWAKIRELSFLQEREGEIVARVIKAPQFSESEIERKLLEEIYRVLGEKEFHVEIAFVNRLPLTKRTGKLKFLDQRLPIGFEQLDSTEMKTTETARKRKTAILHERDL
jgi:phenylacetate-CoA ligase